MPARHHRTRLTVLAAASLCISCGGGGTPPPAGTWQGNVQRTGVYDTDGVRELHRRRWQFVTRSPVRNTPVIAKRTLFVTNTPMEILWAVDTKTGRERWRFEREPAHVIRASPAVADGFVYIADQGGDVHALDAGSGAVRWRAHVHGSMNTTPTVAGRLVFVGTDTGRLYALDRKTGTERWTRELVPMPGTEDEPPDVTRFHGNVRMGTAALADGTLYVGAGIPTHSQGEGFHLYAVDAKKGKVKWRVETGGAVTPVLAGDTAYFVDDRGKLHALDLKRQEEKWQRTDRPAADRDSPPVVADGMLYVGAGGVLLALDAATGEEAWRFEAAHRGGVKHVVLAGGLAYFVLERSGDNYVYAVDLATHEEAWKLVLQGGRLKAAPMILDGVLYFGTNDGVIYAFE